MTYLFSNGSYVTWHWVVDLLHLHLLTAGNLVTSATYPMHNQWGLNLVGKVDDVSGNLRCADLSGIIITTRNQNELKRAKMVREKKYLCISHLLRQISVFSNGMRQLQQDKHSRYYRANNTLDKSQLTSCLLSTRSRLYISIEMNMSDQTKRRYDGVLWYM